MVYKDSAYAKEFYGTNMLGYSQQTSDVTSWLRVIHCPAKLEIEIKKGGEVEICSNPIFNHVVPVTYIEDRLHPKEHRLSTLASDIDDYRSDEQKELDKKVELAVQAIMSQNLDKVTIVAHEDPEVYEKLRYYFDYSVQLVRMCEILQIEKKQAYRLDPIYATYETMMSDEEDCTNWPKMNSFSSVLREIRDFSPIIQLKDTLTDLTVSSSGLTSSSFVTELKHLQALDLSENELTDLKPLAELEDLEKLSINKNLIADLSPLASLKKLRFLHIENTRVNDLRPLQDLENLKILLLIDYSNIDLAKCPVDAKSPAVSSLCQSLETERKNSK